MKLPAMWNLFGDDHVPYQLLLLAKLIDRHSARQLQAEHGLSLAEWRVLAFIGSSGPASASEIGTAGEIDRAEISRAVSKLLEAGLVQRHPCESNRRRLIISVTPAGQAKFEQVRADRRKFFAEITASLSQQDRARLSGDLEVMARNILGAEGA
ncbi:MarR family winged helix-turn-helix transcriptional regulator [Altererythrobacter sp. B11]|uniref:MarR family winged helix-turn-helix transcriptional regulator n=1 Tax=Altererythrobacter sp. B11 TaxID=2060312 RepID=UPI0015593ED6|nr:MarR family transcriptional regulator [Altererythrobacter sp. B11]